MLVVFCLVIQQNFDFRKPQTTKLRWRRVLSEVQKNTYVEEYLEIVIEEKRKS